MKLKSMATGCILGLSVALSAAAAEPTRVQPAAVEVQARAAAPAGATLGSRAEQQRYAAREAKSAAAKNFQGGDYIVISASAVAVILLVILIIILI